VAERRFRYDGLPVLAYHDEVNLRHGAILGCLLATACGSSGVDPATIPTGPWGSVAVGMTVTSSGATLTFCCSHGTISGPLTVGANGGFSLGGNYSSLQQTPVPATYSGTLSGNTMTLDVSAPPYSPWSATLTYGRQPTDLCFCPAIQEPTQ
jgi:hypothetical protein